MEIDGRTLPEGHVLETDLCIVGAGAAGITIARELRNHPVRICLVESGGLEFELDVQDLCKGELVGLPYDIYGTRLRFFGGSTNHWGGWCRPLDPFTFEDRPWIPVSGWPFPYEELAAYYPEAARRVEIAPLDLKPALWEERVGMPLFAFPDDSPLMNLIFKVSAPTNFAEVWGPDVRAADNVTICLNSTIVRLEANAAGQWVERVHARTLAGNDFAIDARQYLLACGGLENPRLLLLSNDVERGGLGNRHDLVGRYFMEHGHFDFARLALTDATADPRLYLQAQRVPDHGEVNGHLAFPPEVQRREQMTNLTFQIRPRVPSKGEFSVHSILDSLEQGELPEDLGMHLKRILADIGPVSEWLGGRLKQKLFGGRGYGDVLAIRSVGEQVPNAESRLTLADDKDALGLPRTRLDWRQTEIDLRTRERAGEIMATEFGRLGLGRVQLLPDEGESYADWYIQPGYHHVGTTRMADDPRNGVVDRNGRVHSVGNLHIAGSSVFPVEGGVTPTLTIVALALRLADHLKAEVFPKSGPAAGGAGASAPDTDD